MPRAPKISELLQRNVFKVEAGIPVPPQGEWASRAPSANTLFLTGLNAGDSFLIPAHLGSHRIKIIMTSLRATAKRLRIPLAARNTDKGLRVWRVAGEWTPRNAKDQPS